LSFLSNSTLPCLDSSVPHPFPRRRMRENDCIRTGYRVHYTYRACVKSFWRLHNGMRSLHPVRRSRPWRLFFQSGICVLNRHAPAQSP
jgi:hypothetical protein